MTALVLVVPFGVEETLTPWGVRVLSDFVSRNRPEVRVRVVDLHRDPVLEALRRRFDRDLLPELTPLLLALERARGLQDSYRGELFRTGAVRAHRLGVAAHLGERLLDVLAGEGVRVPRHRRARLRDQLRTLQLELTQHVRKELVAAAGEEQNPVFGISVYDLTLFNALHHATVIRRAFPEATILMGGGELDHPMAQEIVTHVEAVDACVLGYGELPLLRILDTLAAGDTLRDVSLPVVVHRHDGESLRHAPDLEAEVAAQLPTLRERSAETHVFFDEATRTVRVLGRRGCGYGRCSFCSILIKRAHYDGDLEATKAAVEEILTRTGGAVSSVSFESENNDPQFVVDLLKWIAQHPATQTSHIDVWFFMNVRNFSRDIVRELAELKKMANVDLLVTVAFESLNPSSLEAMRKGFGPLQALYALKVLHDLGGENLTNYFLYFPRESTASVAREVEIMSAALHLISAPRTHLRFTRYFAQTSDDISLNPEAYGLRMRKQNGFWLGEAFGVRLPTSRETLRYSLAPPQTPEDRVTFTHYEWLKDIDDAIPAALRRPGVINWAEAAASAGLLTLRQSRSLFRHLRAQVAARDLSYTKRMGLVLFLLALRSQSDSPTPTSLLKPAKQTPAVVLEIAEGRLAKKRPWPWREQWTLTLSRDELELLRALYAPDRRTKLVARYAREHPHVPVNQLLDKHLRLGTLLEHRGALLCLAHDREALLRDEGEPNRG